MAEDQQQQQQLQYTDGQSTAEQLVLYTISGIGCSLNCLLAFAVLAQRHSRQVTSAFLLHSCLLNAGLSALCCPLAIGLQPRGLPAAGCNKLGVAYVVLMTASVFNLVAVTCCEVYLFDNCSAALQRKPKGSWCCVMFGIFLVYTGSVILHLGPTLIGANFQFDEQRRCLLVYAQTKNYIVFTMWILIVTLALAAACYYLLVFYRVIAKTVQAKLIIISSKQDEIQLNMDAVEQKLDRLADIKHNRQRVLCIACGLHAACWYPLFFLLLADPQFRAPLQLYRALTLTAMLKCALEPAATLIFDSSVSRPLLKLLPCAGDTETEASIDLWLRAVDKPTSSVCGNRHPESVANDISDLRHDVDESGAMTISGSDEEASEVTSGSLQQHQHLHQHLQQHRFYQHQHQYQQQQQPQSLHSATRSLGYSPITRV